MIREWANGRRGLSEMYAELFTAVFGVPFTASSPVGSDQLGDDDAPATQNGAAELADRLKASVVVDGQLIELFESQTQSLRLLDRQLGAARLLAQTEAHIVQMTELLRYSLPGGHRSALGAAIAEAAALAGWQALDLGDPAGAWRHHETAKAAAYESGNVVILAHVTAQQAYALLDAEQHEHALPLVTQALTAARGKVPNLLWSWLSAVQAEAAAARGEEQQTRQAIDRAADVLPSDPVDPELPFVVLDEVHLMRWRGHCLARLGSAEAVHDLRSALADLDPSFTRAAAALHCDLALTHSVRGDHQEARAEAQTAEQLAARTGSARQHRRITTLIASGNTHRCP
ncbi:hypothetical protein [Phytoactinopolyspora mesophila]|uniref:Uncharacterized protein n=1 Tax=Phytoactinopolyspora mesophila TaxID=2650750 RepID=A0A7K3MDA2_9ACTN|nr:hypothetical protein [Phytoactinopolyspora mesophila]NDL60972.1 hypothetical protein [Phytoactinopolyspora mesophila]